MFNRYAISKHPEVTSVTLVVSKYTTASADLSYLGKVVNLTITSSNESTSSSTLDALLGASFWPTITLTSTTKIALNYLTVEKVNVIGSLNVTCASKTLQINLLNALFGTREESHHLNVYGCTMVLLDVHNTTFINTLMSVVVFNISQISISDSIFEGNMSQADALKVTADTGLVIDMMGRNGRHSIVIQTSVFENCGLIPTVDNPSGALVVVSRRDTNQLKLSITDSVFDSNNRAVDISLKGTSDTVFMNNQFLHNVANGSGGAVRFTATADPGFGSLTTLDHTSIIIFNCTFDSNRVFKSETYQPTDMYYASRSPSNGGALYVNLNVQSPLDYDGLVVINSCTFINNSADMQGGVIYLDSGISARLTDCRIENEFPVNHPRFGEILRASNNITIESVSIRSLTTSEAPIIFYEASNSYDYRLLIANVSLQCPAGHRIQLINTSSVASVEGVSTLQV